MTRKPATKTSRKSARKPARGGLNPTRLPYAEETEAATEVLDFLFNRLPNYVASELHNIDVAVSEAALYRELSNLSDETLRSMGLKRSDLPPLVASTFHIIRFSNGPKARTGRKGGAKRQSPKRAAKRKTRRKAARRAASA